MKISSNFSDYYDSMRSMDTDPDPLYVRITKEIEPVDPYNRKKLTEAERLDQENVGRIGFYIPGYNDNLPSWCSTGVIGFCGRVYPWISVGRDTVWYGGSQAPKPGSRKYAFDPISAQVVVEHYKETFEDALSAKAFKNEKENLLNLMRGKGPARYEYDNAQKRFTFANWQSFIDNAKLNIGDQVFRHFKSPVVSATKQGRQEYNFFVNPRLNQFNFVQVFTPHQVWQELSMYAGNNLANLDRVEPRAITDKLKAETKGFDKWSFKNQKNRQKSERGDW